METIPKADCENIGFFRKTHGVHGDLVLEFEENYEFSVEEADRFFVELEGLLVPFFLTENGFRFKGANTAILKLDGVVTEKYAKRLVGNSVYLFETEIVDEIEETTESKFEGYLVFDQTIGEIGRIIHIENFSGNIVFTVEFRGEELLIPYNEEFLLKEDEANKTITLKLPEGLIES
jgi:16S rRNA processing protein RimM